MALIPTSHPKSLTNEVANEVAKVAADMDRTYGFTGVAHITASCQKSAGLFSFGESAARLTETAGKTVIGGMTTALMTGSGLAACAVGTGIAINTLFSGSKSKATREL